MGGEDAKQCVLNTEAVAASEKTPAALGQAPRTEADPVVGSMGSVGTLPFWY